MQLGIQDAADSPTSAPRAIQRHMYSTTLLSGGAGPADDLLMFSMPHHRAALLSPLPSAAANVTCKGIRGNLQTVLGRVWTLAHELPGVLWTAPTGLVDTAYIQPIVNQLLTTDVNANTL